MKYLPRISNKFNTTQLWRLFEKNSGFSLVELSVVLTIVAITLAGALDLATSKTEADRVAETNARLDAIETALQAYLLANQRLPCPANAAIATSSNSFGIERTSSTTGCTSSTFTNSYANMDTVPTKTLGLPDKMMFDGWDRRFSYAVDYRFAYNGASCTNTSGAQLCFRDTVISATATAAADQNAIIVNGSSSIQRTNEAVYAIISHGKNGAGAFTYAGSSTRLAASTDNDEKENSGDDRTTATVGFNNIFVQADTTNTFDDILRYKTKAMLIDSANGITDPTTCIAAYNNVNSITVNGVAPTCTSATSVTNCNALATQVDKFCLQRFYQ